MSLPELVSAREQFLEWRGIIAPMVEEKQFLKNLEIRLCRVLECMLPGETVEHALGRILSPNLVASIIHDMVATIYRDPPLPPVLFFRIDRESVAQLLSGVRSAASPSAMVRRREFARRRPLMVQIIDLMLPQETIQVALQRMYVSDNQDQRLSHLWTAFTLDSHCRTPIGAGSFLRIGWIIMNQ